MIANSTPAARKRAAAALTAASGLLATCGFVAACGSPATPGATAAKTSTSKPATSSSSSASSTASSPASAPATPASSPSSPAAATAAGCLASGLQAQLGAAQGTAGTIYQVIVLTNTSASTCTLYGYPGVSFVTGVGGAQIGAPATKNPAAAATQVTLVPGGKASTLLAVHDAGAFPGCKLTGANWLKIYPPGDYGSLYVQYKAQTCANPAKSITSVTVVAAGSGSAS